MKYLTMSVWGNDKRYIEGAKQQIRLSNEFYPDFTVKLYADNIEHYQYMKTWYNLELVERKDDNGVFWRFEPLFESKDNIVIVRDSDGRITHREVKAVNEWLNSDKKFHTFRDHEAHFEFPIIACAFGYKGKLPNSLLDTMKQFKQQPFYYTNDQVYLRDYVWPYVKDNVIVHQCTEGWFKESREKLHNKYSFCGNGYNEYDMPLYPPTLNECVGFEPSKVDLRYKFDKGLLNE
jgi:hypothetical protein